MSSENLLKRYLELKYSKIIREENKLRETINDIIKILSKIKIDGEKLIDLICDPRNVKFSFNISEPFICAHLYQKDKNIYQALVLNTADQSYALFSFETMAWLERISERMVRETIGYNLPEYVPNTLEKLKEEESGKDENKLKELKYRKHETEFTRSWEKYRKNYLRKIKESILEDLMIYLRVDSNIAKKISEELIKIISKEDFPPPPYSIIVNNLHYGFPIQLDKHFYFLEFVNTSKKLNWKIPELIDIWLELIRLSILKNELSAKGIKEILRLLLTAQGDFRRQFIKKLNEWSTHRSREYQYPVFTLITCLTRLLREPRAIISRDILQEFTLLPGSPAYNAVKILNLDNQKIEDAIIYLKGNLHDANEYYFNYFIYENEDKISKLANTFHTYDVGGRKSDQEIWEYLIRYWLLQFENEYVMDLMLDILDNILFIGTDEVCSSFVSWLQRQKLYDKLNDGKVLLICEQFSSVDAVLTQLRRNYLMNISIGDNVYKVRSDLPLGENNEPIDSILIGYLNKDRNIEKDFKDYPDSWTDIIYIEDNIGTGTQASNKLNALKFYIEKSKIENVSIYYWTYYAADKDTLRKLEEKGISNVDIAVVKDLSKESPQTFRVEELIKNKYPNEYKSLMRKLEDLTKRVLYRKPVPNWAKRNNWWLGYGGMGLLVVFEHGTPNNTLPLLWRDADNYFCLFPRAKPKEDNIRWDSIEQIFKNFGGKIL